MDPKIRKEIISSHGPLIASSMSAALSSSKGKGSFSVEDSGPPSPTSGPMINFGAVAPGIYRSSFPMSGNFEHLRSLGLKTILCVEILFTVFSLFTDPKEIEKKQKDVKVC